MTTFNETLKAGAYLVSEANGDLSREQVTLSGGPYDAGKVLGKTTGTQHVAAPVAFAGNAGNGAPGTWTADASALAGDYKLVCIEPATNAGKFEVVRPDGVVDGVATVGVAYNGMINGTIADGSNDFGSGDGFTVTVSYDADGTYTEFNPSATDGSQNACAILYAAADGSGGNVSAVITARQSEVNKGELIWKSGTTDNQKAAALAQLASFGIIGR